MMIKIEMPNYIRKVKLSAKRNPCYYEYNNGSIKFKNKELPVKYFNDNQNYSVLNLKSKYTVVGVTANKQIILLKLADIINNEKELIKHYKLRLFNLDTKKFVLANPHAVGTPNYLTINGQHIYSGKGGEFTRGAMMEAIKQFYAPFIENLKPITKEFYPLRVKLYIFDTVNDGKNDGGELAQHWDVGNRAYPYGKAFLDILANGYFKHNYMIPKIIKDDNRLFITEDPQGGIFCPVEEIKDRKLVFLIGTDNKEFHKNVMYQDLEEERVNLLEKNMYYNNQKIC